MSRTSGRLVPVHGLRYTLTRPLRRTSTPILQNRGAHLQRSEAGDPGRKRLLAARRSPAVVPDCQSESQGPRIPGALAWTAFPAPMTKGTCGVAGRERQGEETQTPAGTTVPSGLKPRQLLGQVRCVLLDVPGSRMEPSGISHTVQPARPGGRLLLHTAISGWTDR